MSPVSAARVSTGLPSRHRVTVSTSTKDAPKISTRTSRAPTTVAPGAQAPSMVAYSIGPRLATVARARKARRRASSSKSARVVPVYVQVMFSPEPWR